MKLLIKDIAVSEGTITIGYWVVEDTWVPETPDEGVIARDLSFTFTTAGTTTQQIKDALLNKASGYLASVEKQEYFEQFIGTLLDIPEE